MKLCILPIVLAAALIPVVFAQAPQTAIAPEKVVARIDGKDITAGEIRATLANMPPDFQKFFAQNPAYAVQQIYLMRHLAELGAKAKLDERSPQKEQLEIARQNILAQAMMSYEQNVYAPPREAVEQYYNANKANYQSAKTRVIVVSFQRGGTVIRPSGTPEPAPTAPQRSEQEARARAGEIREKAKQGEDFAKLVTEYSDDAASKAKGGVTIVKQDSPESPEIKKAIFALSPGDVSEPLRIENSFAIVKLEEKSTEPLNEVEVSVIQTLRAAHVNEWFAGLNSRFTPQVQEPEFFRQAQQPPVVPVKPPVPAAPAK